VTEASAAGLARTLTELRRRLGPALVAERYLPAETAVYADPEPPLAPRLAAALAASGVERLWRHQAAGIELARARRNLLITTATASGKSLVFQVPVLEEALAGGPGRALFLFPLKALGQDQRGKLRALADAAGLDESAFGCEIYDGDTASSRRAAIRRRPPRVLITNPDMLHLGILGHPANWTTFFSELAWIVLDELHVYRGLFGAHFHHVLARLLRLARGSGARPAIVASSATAANAREFAELLAGLPFSAVATSGAPREGRHVWLLRPEGSTYSLALDLLAGLLEGGQKTIVFTKARRITELLYGWLERRDRRLARRVACYRAGFLPEERREIERKLLDGTLDGVISTSALELGIDIGGLDACVLVGFPGSMMATWQRSGRVGRRGRESLTALVAQPDALDQYLLDHPDELLARPCEPLVVDPENEPVAAAHLECAAAEMPLTRERDAEYLARHAAVVGDLLRRGVLAESAEGTGLVARRRRPQRDINLRGTGGTHAIVERASGALVGTIDGARVFGECHPGAIYLHSGRQYEVAELDLARRRVLVVPADVDHFTSPLAEKRTEILEILAETAQGGLRAGLGRLRIEEQVTGFERKRSSGQEVIDQQTLELPPVEMECIGLWWHAPQGYAEELGGQGRHILGALHAAEHAAIGLFPLLALCDRNDLGGISLAHHPQLGGGGVFVYEGHPGGIGIAKKGFAELPGLLARVRELVAGCACERGCPSCIQSPKCGNGNRPLDKAGAVELLGRLLDPRAAAPGARAMIVGPAPVERRAPPEADAPAAGVPPVRAPRAVRTRPGSAAGPRSTVLFDIETLRSADEVGGWHQAHRMGIALAVVCHLEAGRFETFREGRAGELAAALKQADLVVGFNSRRFDYAVLSGYTGEDYARTLPTLDLLESLSERLGHRVGLGHVARETLGVDKSADGLQSLAWVREGRFDLIEEYCRRDVEILRDVYLFGRREGYVVISSRAAGRIRVPVDW